MVDYLKSIGMIQDSETTGIIHFQSQLVQNINKLSIQEHQNYKQRKYGGRTRTPNQNINLRQQKDKTCKDRIESYISPPQQAINPINLNFGCLKLGLSKNINVLFNNKQADKQSLNIRQNQINFQRHNAHQDTIIELVANGLNPSKSSHEQRKYQKVQVQQIQQNSKYMVQPNHMQINKANCNGELVQSSLINGASSIYQESNKITSPLQVKEFKDMKKPQYSDIVKENQFYTYYIGGGNNCELVRRVMQTRQHWKPTTIINSLFNLKWQQSSQNIKFDRLNSQSGVTQIVNHFPNHRYKLQIYFEFRDISDKSNLIFNLKIYCESKKINLFEITPLTFVVDLADDDAELQLSRFSSFFVKHIPKSKRPENYKKLAVEFRKNIKPLLINQIQDKFQKNLNQYSKPRMHPSFEQGDYYLWLLKPSDANRGRGIQLFDSLETLEKILFELKDGLAEYTLQDKKEEKSAQPGVKCTIKTQEFVIQKYVQRPLLIKQRKFDIRVWVLITHQLNCYFFKEGYLRTSCEIFQMDNIQDPLIHLTNNAVQKQSDSYGKFEDGNQLSFDDFDQFLKSAGHEGVFQEKMVPQMKSHICSSLLSVKKNFSQKEYKHCFEIYGYDFIVDDILNMWLIEVNTNPCIEESSPLLQMIIPRMINDAFKLTIDQILPQLKKQLVLSDNVESHETIRQEEFKVTNYGKENMFEFLLSLQPPQVQNSLSRNLLSPQQTSKQINLFNQENYSSPKKTK